MAETKKEFDLPPRTYANASAYKILREYGLSIVNITRERITGDIIITSKNEKVNFKTIQKHDLTYEEVDKILPHKGASYNGIGNGFIIDTGKKAYIFSLKPLESIEKLYGELAILDDSNIIKVHNCSRKYIREIMEYFGDWERIKKELEEGKGS